MSTDASLADVNPYAVSAVADPRPELAVVGVGAWRDGSLLVMHRDAVLPDLCFKTGLPATRRFSQKVQYRERWFATLASATIEVPLSQKWHLLVRLGWSLLALGVVGLYGLAIALVVLSQSRTSHFGVLTLANLLLLGVVLVSGALLHEVVHVNRCRGDYLWLSGASPRFLDQLPAWPPG